MKMRKNDWVSVFIEKSELRFFRKWRWTVPEMCGNDDCVGGDSTVAVIVLAAEESDHCRDGICNI